MSIRLYNLYKTIEAQQEALNHAHMLLINTPVDSSFAKKYPVYDNVCMGMKKVCKCGAPFFF